MNIKLLPDKYLLSHIKNLARNERSITLKVLHHLHEIERRRLFADLGYGSLYEYAIKELGYSEPSASRRIQSARILREFPEIENKIEQGSLTITNVALAASTFKNEGIKDNQIKKEILERIENMTKKECELALLYYSKPNPLPREIEKPLTPNVYGVNFNLSIKTMEELKELRDLLAHKRLKQDEIISFALVAAIEKIKAEKFKVNARFPTPGAKPCTKRYIPAFIKKSVYERDKGQCTNCQSSYKLEYDHIKPFAMGGESTFENLRLLCFSCNQRRIKN